MLPVLRGIMDWIATAWLQKNSPLVLMSRQTITPFSNLSKFFLYFSKRCSLYFTGWEISRFLRFLVDGKQHGNYSSALFCLLSSTRKSFPESPVFGLDPGKGYPWEHHELPHIFSEDNRMKRKGINPLCLDTGAGCFSLPSHYYTWTFIAEVQKMANRGKYGIPRIISFFMK